MSSVARNMMPKDQTAGLSGYVMGLYYLCCEARRDGYEDVAMIIESAIADVAKVGSDIVCDRMIQQIEEKKGDISFFIETVTDCQNPACQDLKRIVGSGDIR